MNPNRRTKREDLEVMLQYKSRQQNLLVDEMIEEKLTQLQGFIGHLARTPDGRDELERRTKRFGECKRIDGETAGNFHTRLRGWLDKDLVRPKRRRSSSQPASD